MIRSRVVAIYMPAEDMFLGEPVIEAMNLFPYAPEYYLPRGRPEQRKLVTQDHGEVEEENAASENNAQTRPSPPMEEEPSSSSGRKGNLNDNDGKKGGPQSLEHENRIDEKGSEK